MLGEGFALVREKRKKLESKLADVGEIAVAISVVHAVADKEAGVGGEGSEVGLEGNCSPSAFVDGDGTGYFFGSASAQVGNDAAQGDAGVQNVVHHEDAFVFHLGRRRAPHKFPAAFEPAVVAGDAHRFQKVVFRKLSQKIRGEPQSPFQKNQDGDGFMVSEALTDACGCAQHGGGYVFSGVENADVHGKRASGGARGD